VAQGLDKGGAGMQDVVVIDVGGGSVKLGSARQPDNPK
jgi:hypothetical protein